MQFAEITFREWRFLDMSYLNLVPTNILLHQVSRFWNDRIDHPPVILTLKHSAPDLGSLLQYVDYSLPNTSCDLSNHD